MLSRFSYAPLLLLFLVLLGGCASVNQTAHVTGVPLPAERMRNIRELGQAARSIPADRQGQYASILFEIIKEEPDALIRREAVAAIAHYQTPLTVQALKHASSDNDRDVRQVVCGAWMVYGGEEAVPELAEILASETDLDIRIDAIERLGQLADKRAVPAMIVPLSTSDPALQHYTMLALQQITGYRSNDAQQWLAYCKGEIEKPKEQLAWYQW